MGLMSYAAREDKVKSSGKLQKQRIMLVESSREGSAHKLESSPSESQNEGHSALGLMDIGKLAGSRTQLEAIKVMNESMLLPVQEAKIKKDEGKEQLPFKFQQRTKSQQPGHSNRQSQARAKQSRNKSKNSQRAAFSISDIIEMQVSGEAKSRRLRNVERRVSRDQQQKDERINELSGVSKKLIINVETFVLINGIRKINVRAQLQGRQVPGESTLHDTRHNCRSITQTQTS